MEEPDGFVENSQSEKICLLKRTIYDLKQLLQS